MSIESKLNSDLSTPQSPEVAELLRQVEPLLAQEHAEKALKFLRHSKLGSPWLINASAVCQMRLGNPKAAVDLLRGLVLASGGLMLRADAPTTFKVNFATALLLQDNRTGCLSTLAEINDPEHPAVRQLQAALDRWRAGLTFWQKLNLMFGGEPATRVELDFPPGNC